MTAATTSSRIDTILPLLACPGCRGAVSRDRGGLRCDHCGDTFGVTAGRPVFVPGLDPRVMPVGHMSNQPPADVMDEMVWQPGWVLNLGAGGTRTKIENVVEVEYSIFRHTDVVADAHHLPFADEAFDAVVTFNTFEHLYDPERASAEVRRVLKPGGRLILQTAFLQPVHEAPHHYYNTTEFGLRRWFRAFDGVSVSVSPNFNPAHVFAWLASDAMHEVRADAGEDACRRLADTTLGELTAAWHDQNLRKNSPVWELLGRLPQDVQKRFAAGFQLEAFKPAS